MAKTAPASGETFRTRLIPALALTLAFSFLLTVYAPLELYFTNVSEFRFDYLALLPHLLLGFAAVAVVGMLAFLLCYVLYVKFFDVVLAAGSIAYICTYIQGMFMAGNLPPIDGSAINWDDYLMQDIASAILWAAVSVIIILLIRFLRMRRMYSVITGLSVFFSVVLLVTMVTVGLQNGGFRLKTEPLPTKDNEFLLSSDENLVILVVDATDSETFREMMETTDPEFRDILEDFTYYPDTLSAYPFTRNSVPFMLTGVWYENQEDFASYSTKAYAASPLLSALREQGYRMGAYEEELTCNSDQIYDFDNFRYMRTRIPDSVGILREEMKLVWFKYSPFLMKRLTIPNINSINELADARDGSELFTARNYKFYRDMNTHEIELCPEKCFRFIHVEGSHVPYRYDRDVNLIPSSQGSYPENIRCSMTIVKTYLEKLKAAGVYDNSAIIVMADHGFGYNDTIPTISRSNALLAIKGIGEHHELCINEAPISFEDLQEAYQRLLSGAPGDAVFDAREGDQRSRRFLYYLYLQEAYMEEYIQPGNAADETTMYQTGNIYELP